MIVLLRKNKNGKYKMNIKNNYKHTLTASYFGYVVQSIINNFAPLLFVTFQNTFGFTYRQISSLIFINFGLQLVVDLIATKAVDKIGYRKCTVAAHVFASAGLFLLGVLPFCMNPFFAVVISIMIYATGSGLIEVIISPLVEACPTENKSGSMSFLHSFYCWGQMAVVLLSTAYFSLFGTDKWQYLSMLWATVPLFNGVYMCFVPFPEMLSENKGMGVRALFKNKIFYLCAVIMFCAGASELAMSQWASAFAENGLGVSKTMGDILGPCLFAVMMGMARVLYATVTKKITLHKFMLLSSLLCVICYLGASLSENAVLALFFCSVCGFSVGVMWPGTFSLGAEKIPQGGTAMFALLALFGDLGCATGPATVGIITSFLGGDISKGLIFAAAFPLILTFMLKSVKQKT